MKRATRLRRVIRQRRRAVRRSVTSHRKRVVVKKARRRDRKKNVRRVLHRHRRVATADVKRSIGRRPKVIPARAVRRTIKGGVVRHKGKVRLMASRTYERRSFTKIKRDKRKVKVRARRPRVNRFPAMPIYRIHTRELAHIRLYDRHGNIRKSALKRFNKLVRCYRKNVVIPLNYRLLVEMYQAWLHFGQPMITVYSGCRRPPQASSTSRHVTGDAVDFAFDGVSRRRLATYYLKRREALFGYKLGVGFYPNSYHIHLDIRKKHAFWVQLVDEEGNGHYAANPYRTFFKKRGSSKRAGK